MRSCAEVCQPESYDKCSAEDSKGNHRGKEILFPLEVYLANICVGFKEGLASLHLKSQFCHFFMLLNLNDLYKSLQTHTVQPNTKKLISH